MTHQAKPTEAAQGPEYVGAHGGGGLVGPPLEYFDERFDWHQATPEYIENMQNWREKVLHDYTR